MSMFLNEALSLQSRGDQVRIYTINGVPIDGKILNADESGILIKSQNHRQFIRAEAISTIGASYT